jgi:hypothetical protein
MATYVCPINSAHRFTDRALYIAHFGASHTSQIKAFTILPTTVPYAVSVSIAALFGLDTQIGYVQGTVNWKSRSGAPGYHFYVLYLKSPTDIEVNPHRLRAFHGVPGSGPIGSFLIGKMPAGGGRPQNRIDVDEVLSDILIQAFEDTKNEDLIDPVKGVSLVVQGWV